MSAPEPVCVLMSGGLDSSVLLSELARSGPVVPVYVRTGLYWEAAEQRWIERYLRAANGHAIAPLAVLDVPFADLYDGGHWAMRGDAPAYDTPDEDVYLPGRNVILLGKTAVFCALRGIHAIALGTLAGNPFPDVSPAFLAATAIALSAGLKHSIEILTPYRELHKEDVIRRGREFPLALTLSCISPVRDGHCGRCSKCRERHDAFRAAGVSDPTDYASPPPR